MDLKQLCAYTILFISLTTSVFSLDNFGCGKLPANIYENGNTSTEYKTSPWFAIAKYGPLNHQFFQATLISRNLVIFTGHFSSILWPYKELLDEKGYTVQLGITLKKLEYHSHTHEFNVSHVYYKELRDGTPRIQKLTILVLAETVSISEYIMPICVDWSMQYHLQNNDILEYEGITGYGYGFIMVREPTKCMAQDRCIFDAIRDIDIDKTLCCKQPETPLMSDFGNSDTSGSVLTSEHNGLRYLIAMKRFGYSEYRPYYSFTDISLHIQWIQSVYKNHTVTCPPMKSNSLEIKCIKDGKENDCSSESLPGTKLIPRCKQLYKLPNGREEKSIELNCLPDGKWSDQLYDCVPAGECRNKNCVEGSSSVLAFNKCSMPLLPSGDKLLYLGIFFKANWYKAHQYCRYHGMHLTSINNQEENDRLKKYIKDYGFEKESFWTSGTDQGQEGSFYWFSNGRPIIGFTDWLDGNSSNGKHPNGGTKNCLELWNPDSKGHKWNDSDCSDLHFFVCEI